MSTIEQELATPFVQELRRCAERPAYSATKGKTFDQWFTDNRTALRGYYEAIGGKLPDPKSRDGLLSYSRAQTFLRFCMCQFDIARGTFT